MPLTLSKSLLSFDQELNERVFEEPAWGISHRPVLWPVHGTQAIIHFHPYHLLNTHHRLGGEQNGHRSCPQGVRILMEQTERQ